MLSKSSGSSRRNVKRYAVAAGVTSVAGVSLYVRRWRVDKLGDLQEAQSSGVFVTKKSAKANSTIGPKPNNVGVAKSDSNGGRIFPPLMDTRARRDLHILATTVSRTGLMGTSVPGAESVKAELESIRSWHQKRGFNGGLVLRELNQPLFEPDEVEGGDDVEPVPHHELMQRECYYLYYEIMPNGETRQQIFCRGTTLTADVYTCLHSKFVFDHELGCKLHAGFRNHADRLISDVEPLLAPKGNRRATVEICGHSLGGAVAFIVAMKLKKRGYNVIRLTSVASPRFCENSAIDTLSSLLPVDTLRIEDDLDAVTYLPPLFKGLGDKLWFVTGKGDKEEAYFVPFKSVQEEKWLESVSINSRIPETLVQLSTVHRVPSYVSKIQNLAKQVEQVECQSLPAQRRGQETANDFASTESR